jgi:hypothetical protein
LKETHELLMFECVTAKCRADPAYRAAETRNIFQIALQRYWQMPRKKSRAAFRELSACGEAFVVGDVFHPVL